jgi:hypothetical protein
VQLICEGKCNPSRPDYDAAVVNDRRIPANGDLDFYRGQGMVFGKTITGLSPALLTLGRSLAYTPHAHVHGDSYGCLVCSSVRRFGKTA